MRKSLILILIVLSLKLYSQCNYTIVPSYTPASCATCCDGSITFSLSGSGPLCGPLGYSLQPVSGSFTGVWSNLCAGSYTIVFQDGTCCLAYCQVVLGYGSTGINKVNIDASRINLFPNPVSNILHIESEEYFEARTETEIVNAVGQTVLKQGFSREIDVSSLPSGIYTMRLSSKNQTAQRRLVITK